MIDDEENDKLIEQDPPITERDIRIIAAGLHDEGKGHVLADMIDAVTGMRPPDDAFSPRKMRIRDPGWRKARQQLKRQKYRIGRKARMTDEETAARVAGIRKWEADHSEKMAARRLNKRKEARAFRELIAVDIEGFNTGIYYTDDRRDYAREYREALARGTDLMEPKIQQLLKDHIFVSPEEREQQHQPFAGWTPHNHQWYLDQHNLTGDDPIPSARNKKPGTPPIYIEHRPFLFGAGNDHEQYFLTGDDEYIDGAWTTGRTKPASKKTPLSGAKILNAIVDLKKRFRNSIFITFAFNYDTAQNLRVLTAEVAGQLQAGEIVEKWIDEDGAPCEKIIEQATFAWNEFAISYRRGKMFRVGRLNEPGKLYTFIEITDPEERQAYIDAIIDPKEKEEYVSGRKVPTKRKIDYKDEPVTLSDTFGFFHMSFVDAYEGSGISYTLEEAKIIVEGKRKRNIMASLPIGEVIRYQGMELKLLCRMMNKLIDTTNGLVACVN